MGPLSALNALFLTTNHDKTSYIAYDDGDNSLIRMLKDKAKWRKNPTIKRSENLEKKICCLGFFKKSNAGAILCTENCPSVHFLEESRTPKFAFEIY